MTMKCMLLFWGLVNWLIVRGIKEIAESGKGGSLQRAYWISVKTAINSNSEGIWTQATAYTCVSRDIIQPAMALWK